MEPIVFDASEVKVIRVDRCIVVLFKNFKNIDNVNDFINFFVIILITFHIIILFDFIGSIKLTCSYKHN